MSIQYPWRDEYDTGIEEIDLQHRYFLSLINRLATELAVHENAIYQERLFGELTRYAAFHFVSEENLMLKLGYPDFDRHHLLHRELLNQLSWRMRRENSESLIDFLATWFSSHTVQEDRHIGEFVRHQEAAGVPPKANPRVELGGGALEARMHVALADKPKVLSVSEGMEALLGYTQEDFLSTRVDFRDRIHPDDLDIAEALFSAEPGQKSGTFTGTFNIRLRQANGRIRCIKGEFTKETDPERPVLLVLLLQDAKSLHHALDDQALSANFRAMMENAEDYIYFKDRNHVFTGASQSSVSICDPAGHWTDLLGKTDYDVFPEALADNYYRLEKQVFAGIPVAHEVQETLTKEGKKGWVDNRKYPIIGAQGAIIGLFGIARDITAMVQAEAALRASEENLHNYVANAPEGIFVTDVEGRYLDVNPAACLLTGYTREELLGMDISVLSPTGPSPEYLKRFATVKSQGTFSDEVLLRRKEGTHVTVTLRAVLLPDGRVMGFCSDISELVQYRQHLEAMVQERTERLLETEARSSHILQSSADGLYGVDAEGRVTFINPAACALLGHSQEQVIGRNSHSLFHHSKSDGSRYPYAECLIHNALQRGEEVRVDDEVYWHADGHAVPVMYAMHPMVQEGKITGAVISLVDTSVQRAAAQAREQALNAAVNLARLRSEFLANMSHEIRTPLNGVLGFAAIGQRNYQNPEKALNAFNQILGSGERLLGIINDILDFSKIEAGKLHIEQTQVLLIEAIRQTLDLIKERAQAKGLSFQVKLAPGLPETFLGDPLRLDQVLLNLLTNAVKFTESGSVTLSVKRQGEELVFKVSDTGIGMNEEQLGQLFQPFQQADGSTTRKYGGTGLGLAISKRILDLMGGHIRVESQPGQGSCFEFRLVYVPATAEAEAATPERMPADQRLAGLSILAAEDDPVNQLVLETLLQEDGARVVMVGNGREAVDRVALDGADAYDLVLMDVQMPLMSGYEATRQILALAPDLPIVGQTAYSMAEEKANCYAAGMVDHIAKPLDPDALVRIVLKHVRRGR